MASAQHRVAVIGYGGAFNMGRHHLGFITKHDGFEPAAVCDSDAARAAVAKQDFPGIETYTDVATMLRESKPDLVVIITPHNTHCELTLQCLEAGAGVIVEKPMAVSAAEADAMVRKAEEKGLLLTTFHNRRWDGDHIALMKLVGERRIGRIFRIEAGFWGYGKQGSWWRSRRAISGGHMFDWGAHFTDWILRVVPGRIAHVTGFMHKNPAWTEYDNDDHGEMHVRFEDGAYAQLVISNNAMIKRPWWTILGDEGSIVKDGNAWIVSRKDEGELVERHVPFAKAEPEAFYENIVAHLRGQAELAVDPRSAARVIAVLDAAYQSHAQGGKPVAPRFG